MHDVHHSTGVLGTPHILHSLPSYGIFLKVNQQFSILSKMINIEIFKKG
jgi:hypothetical protein